MFGSLNQYTVKGLTNVGNKIKIDHKVKVDVSESILLSCLFFGSLYMFSTSMIGINKMFLKDQQRPFNTPLLVMNGSLIIISGYVLILSGYQAFPLGLRPINN